MNNEGKRTVILLYQLCICDRCEIYFSGTLEKRTTEHRLSQFNHCILSGFYVARLSSDDPCFFFIIYVLTWLGGPSNCFS